MDSDLECAAVVLVIENVIKRRKASGKTENRELFG